MTFPRMDHVSVVVDDLPAAIAFFGELGLEVEGETSVEGDAVSRVSGIDGVHAEIAMLRTPDGHGRLELTHYTAPAASEVGAGAPANTLGLRSVMFEVDDIDDAVGRLRARGAELVGEVVEYEDVYRLCYLRGPAGIIVSLAQDLRRDPVSR